MRQVILFLEQQSWRSGAERVLDEVLQSLGEQFQPLVAFPEDGPFVRELAECNIETLLFPLGHYRAGPKSLADMTAFPLRSLHCAGWLARFIQKRDVRLVYVNGPRCLAAGMLAARLTGRPSLFHLHMTMTRRTDRFVAASAARYVTRIVACSKTSAMALSRGDVRLDKLTRIIYNPARKPYMARHIAHKSAVSAALPGNASRPVVGVVGRITPQKGQHVLLKAAARLARKGRHIQVIFVGAPDKASAEDTAYVRFLESCIRELDLEGQVSWAGYQNDPNPFYAIFDVLVIPSTVSEGLPMVALEALQWGVPVIGSQIGGIPEVIHAGVNGLLTPPEDDKALADCLAQLIDANGVIERLRAGARSTADSRFSVDTFRNQIRRTLFELCPS